MCLITFQYQPGAEYPLIVVQNRDESYERESLPIHFWNDFPNVLAGRDKKHGGAWSGVTKSGQFAALTNRPFTDFPQPKDSLSRGKLVKDYLTKEISSDNYLTYLKESRYHYDSYHLIFGSIDEFHFYTNATDEHFIFKPGLFSISNTNDDLSVHKKTRSKELVKDYLTQVETPDLDKLIELFQDTVPANRLEEIPEDVPLDLAKRNSSIFIQGEEFGTVNTTAFVVHKSGQLTMKEVRYNEKEKIETTEETMIINL